VSDTVQRSPGSQSVRPGRKSVPSLGRSTIDRYEVIYPIAHGGMAGVHVGRLPGMAGFEKLVAIKVIHEHLSAEREFVEMFLDEARLAAQIRHPNVAEVFEVGEDDGLYFMVGELIEGQNLRVVFRRARDRAIDIPPALSARIAAQTARGLHSAHELLDQSGQPLNLVHRDVSLHNILLSHAGYVKLIDFGVAWAEGRLAHTKTGTLKGKIGFMSPEQILGKQLDRRSDIFSLGVVLYQMVTGFHPFRGDSDADRIRGILETDPTPPREVNPRISSELEGIVLTAMTKSREQRYPNASVFCKELEAFVASTGEDVGTKALSALMGELFEEEIAAHHEQLRTYRANRQPEAADTSASSPAPPTPDGDCTSAARPSAKQRERAFVTRRSKRLGIVAIVGIAVLGVIGVLLTVSFAQPDEPDAPPPAPRNADENPLPETPEPESVEPVSEQHADEAEPVSTVVVTIEVRPEDARITLDGDELAAGTDRIELPANGTTHNVKISAPGFQPATKEVVADSDQRLSLELVPKPRKSKPGKAGKNAKMDEDFDLIHSPYR